MANFHDKSIEQLLGFSPQFEDGRLAELLLRVKARNFPNTLTYEEQVKWQHHRSKRLVDGDGSSLTMNEFAGQIESLMVEHNGDNKKLQILKDLLLYGQSL